MSKTLLLIDAHAMIHRAYHALPPTLTSPDGTPTNAIHGFFLMLSKAVTEFAPSHLAICFDTPKPTFRKKLYPKYQAKRPPMLDALKVQIPIIKEMLNLARVSCLEKEGFEADDVIGTLAREFKANFDKVLILTGDRDLLQLTDKNVYVITPKTGISSFTLYTEDAVKEKFGVTAKQIPDLKALAGDASDNYNTARGIGPKTAAKLLLESQTVEKLLEDVERVTNDKIKQILIDNKETVLLFKRIATIVLDVDVHPTERQLLFSGFSDELKVLLSKYGLYSLSVKLFGSKTVVEKPEKEKQISLF